MIRIEYEKFVNYILKEYTQGRRDLIGCFKRKGSDKIITGDNFSALNVSDNAEKSYKAALKYFNHTRNEFEKERVFVSAEWKG